MPCPYCNQPMHLSSLKAFWVCPNGHPAILAVSMSQLDRMADYWHWLRTWNTPDQPHPVQTRDKITMQAACK